MRAGEYLRLYPGGSDGEVLDSILHADAHRVVHRAVDLWAREHARTGPADAYVFFFTRVPPDPALGEFGAHHGAELMYAYGTPGLTLPQRHGVRWVHGFRGRGPTVQFGISTVGGIAPDPVTGGTQSEAERLRTIVRIARRADELDVVALGEHRHLPDQDSGPAVPARYPAA